MVRICVHAYMYHCTCHIRAFSSHSNPSTQANKHTHILTHVFDDRITRYGRSHPLIHRYKREMLPTLVHALPAHNASHHTPQHHLIPHSQLPPRFAEKLVAFRVFEVMSTPCTTTCVCACTVLQDLSVFRCGVDEGTVEACVSTLRKTSCTLTTLDLGSNDLTDEAVAPLIEWLARNDGAWCACVVMHEVAVVVRVVSMAC